MEFCNVLLRKLNYTKTEIDLALKDFKKNFEISIINYEVIEDALRIKQMYKYSFFDSVIISSAIYENCRKIYSEDMQHKQFVDNKLKIINPFL